MVRTTLVDHVWALHPETDTAEPLAAPGGERPCPAPASTVSRLPQAPEPTGGPLTAIELRTFADYGERFGWFAHCPQCGRDRPFTREEIAERFGLDANVHAIRERLRCSECRRGGCLLYCYYRLPPPDDPTEHPQT